MHIVDRRLNPSGKNLANRQRFMRRAKSLIRKAVHESSASRSIKDADQAGEVALPAQGVHEPSFHRSASGGMRDHLLPGNKQYIEGDTIPRPQGGAGGGGSEGSPDGDGQDDFRFALSRDEFVDLFLEDLELPDLAKRRVVDSESVSWHRAGYSVTGSPANLALLRTVRNSLSRRIALKRPKPDELQRLRDEIAALSPDGDERAHRVELEAELDAQAAPHRADPVHRPARCALSQVRAAAEAGGAGGDVLPDGRVRLDDRAHEGPRQAVLRAALHLPEAPLQARGRGVHPPYASGAGSGRGYILPLAGDRRHGGIHRARGDAARRRRALQPGFVEHLRRAGVGRRQHRLRQRQDGGAADRHRSCRSASTTPISRSAAIPSTSRPASSGATPIFGRPTRRSAKTGAPMAMRKVGHRRDIYPVFRELFAKKQATTGAETA